jgi:hypothetical protein
MRTRIERDLGEIMQQVAHMQADESVTGALDVCGTSREARANPHKHLLTCTASAAPTDPPMERPADLPERELERQ